jgi:hypothetical protein
VPNFLVDVIFDCLSSDPELRPTPVEIILRLDEALPTLTPEGLMPWS